MFNLHRCYIKNTINFQKYPGVTQEQIPQNTTARNPKINSTFSIVSDLRIINTCLYLQYFVLLGWC